MASVADAHDLLLRDLPKTTGHPLPHWLQLLESGGMGKKGIVAALNYLRDEHRISHEQATAIAYVYRHPMLLPTEFREPPAAGGAGEESGDGDLDEEEPGSSGDEFDEYGEFSFSTSVTERSVSLDATGRPARPPRPLLRRTPGREKGGKPAGSDRSGKLARSAKQASGGSKPAGVPPRPGKPSRFVGKPGASKPSKFAGSADEGSRHGTYPPRFGGKSGEVERRPKFAGNADESRKPGDKGGKHKPGTSSESDKKGKFGDRLKAAKFGDQSRPGKHGDKAKTSKHGDKAKAGKHGDKAWESDPRKVKDNPWESDRSGKFAGKGGGKKSKKKDR